jgi:cytosine/adenosine deaminase-related metal-dependent hydrolase
MSKFKGAFLEKYAQKKEANLVHFVNTKGNWILPGLINTHVHTSQVCMLQRIIIKKKKKKRANRTQNKITKATGEGPRRRCRAGVLVTRKNLAL